MYIEKIDLKNLKFEKLKPIGDSKGYITTTHVDKHGERFSLRALKKVLETTKEKIWINSNHDPSKTPVAKIVSSEIRKMDANNYGVYVVTEVYDKETLQKMISGEIKGFSPEFVGK